MKYSEYPYKRMDIQQITNDVANLISEFEQAQSAKTQINILKRYNDLSAEYSTYEAMASLNFARDTKDISAKAENDYYDQINPEFSEIDNKFSKIINASKFKNELRKEFGNQYFDLLEMRIKAFDPKIVNLLKRQNEIVNEYTALLAGAEIEFDGKTLNLSGLGPYMQDLNRETRKKAWHAKDQFFAKNSEQLDMIYDRLVQIRHQMAQILGFENFVPLGYLNMSRSEYGAEDVAKYREQIVKHIVPLTQKIREKRCQILGYDNMFVYDSLYFKEGNPKPKGDPDHLVAQARKMYSEFSPETEKFFNIMINEELMDLVNRAGKAGGGFCTSFPSQKRPYIFSNFNGTDHDVTVLTHEAGHAFQAYQSRKQPLNEYLWPTYEAAEIHSMSMEFLTWDWMNLFFEKDTDKFKFMHLASSLSFLPYGALVDHFQHWVYENPSATPGERKKQWLELEKIYQPGKNYDDLEFYAQGGLWQGQSHLFHMPFYYIDYTLAQVCAFQFWIRMNEDRDAAWRDYLQLCKAGGSLSFLKLVKLAKLRSPFDPQIFKEVANKINEWLVSRT